MGVQAITGLSLKYEAHRADPGALLQQVNRVSSLGKPLDQASYITLQQNAENKSGS